MTASHYSNSQNLIISFDNSWFLVKDLSNFVSLPWKLHNRYCHNVHRAKLARASVWFIYLSQLGQRWSPWQPAWIDQCKVGLGWPIFSGTVENFLNVLYQKFIVLFVFFCLNGQCQRRMSKRFGIEVHVLSNLGQDTTRLFLNMVVLWPMEAWGYKNIPNS